jgi:hypothetical protein
MLNVRVAHFVYCIGSLILQTSICRCKRQKPSIILLHRCILLGERSSHLMEILAKTTSSQHDAGDD